VCTLYLYHDQLGFLKKGKTENEPKETVSEERERERESGFYIYCLCDPLKAFLDTFSLSFTHTHTLSLSPPIIIMKWPLSRMCVRVHSVVYMIAIIESANAVLGQRSNFTFSPAHNKKSSSSINMAKEEAIL